MSVSSVVSTKTLFQGSTLKSPPVTANDRSGIADAHLNPAIVRTGSYIFSDSGGTPRLFSDATSIRSLASIGVGSTDGRRMVIRRVPNSPTELLTIINPPT